jgi:hypothetical protein
MAGSAAAAAGAIGKFPLLGKVTSGLSSGMGMLFKMPGIAFKQVFGAFKSLQKRELAPVLAVAPTAATATSYIFSILWNILLILLLFFSPYAFKYIQRNYDRISKKIAARVKKVEDQWYEDHSDAGIRNTIIKWTVWPLWLLVDVFVFGILGGIAIALKFLVQHLFQVILLIILAVVFLTVEANYVPIVHSANTATIYAEEAAMQTQLILLKLQSFWNIIIVPLNEVTWVSVKTIIITLKYTTQDDSSVLGRRLTSDDDNNVIIDAVTTAVFSLTQIQYALDKAKLFIFELIMIILSPIINIVLQIFVSLAAKAICIMADPICAIIEVIAELFYLIVNGVLKLISIFGVSFSVDRSAFFYCKPTDFRSPNLARGCGGGIFASDPIGAWYSQLESDASSSRRLLSCTQEYDFFVERLDGKTIHKGKQKCPYTIRASDKTLNAIQMHSFGIHSGCYHLCTDNILYEVCHQDEHKIEKIGTCNDRGGVQQVNATKAIEHGRVLIENDGDMSMVDFLNMLKKTPRHFTVGNVDCDMDYPDMTFYGIASKVFCLGGYFGKKVDFSNKFKKESFTFGQQGRRLGEDDASNKAITGKFEEFQKDLIKLQHSLRMYQSFDGGVSVRRRLEKTMSVIDRRTVDLNETRAHIANLLEPIEPRKRRSLREETFGTCSGEDDYPCPSSRGKFMCVKLEDREKCPQVDTNKEGVTYWEKFNSLLFSLGLVRFDLMGYLRDARDCYDRYDLYPETLPFRATMREMEAALGTENQIVFCPGMNRPLNFEKVDIDRKGINRIVSDLCDPETEPTVTSGEHANNGEYVCSCKWYYDITSDINSRVYSFETVQLFNMFMNALITLQLGFEVIIFNQVPFVNDCWVWFWTLDMMPDIDARFVHFFGNGALPGVTYSRRFACAGLKAGSLIMTIIFCLSVYILFISTGPLREVLSKHFAGIKNVLKRKIKEEKIDKQKKL